MEAIGSKSICRVLCRLLLLIAVGVSLAASAQPVKHYTIKNGKMYIELTKDILPAELDSFITQFDLHELGLKSFLRSNGADSLSKLGWKIEINNESGIVISKAFEPFDVFKDPAEKFVLPHENKPLFPAINNGISYGVNRFKNKASFSTKDSTVRFFLRQQLAAGKVMLAGSFNDWRPDQLAMQRTDSGWIYELQLGPGKYWYKFVIDGNWVTDMDNPQAENDGLGNTNSVFFKPNTLFKLDGFSAAKKVFVAGSFNEWRPQELALKKVGSGWELPLYLADGTHTYKFVVDGRWLSDPASAEKLPDGHGDSNSVMRLGKPYQFRLSGFENAKDVFLIGSFNRWRDGEFRMTKVGNSWQLPYTLGPGNYEYKFVVDGKKISDPSNEFRSGSSGNSLLIIEPNYTFRLKGFADARQVFLTGDFNQWDPAGFAMKKQNGEWVLPLQLSVGKHRYKFIVDGKWIIDPGNRLWEQNEFGTGNSVLWIER